MDAGRWPRVSLVLLIVALGGYLRFQCVAQTQVVAPLRADAGDYFSYAYNLRYHQVYARTFPHGEIPRERLVPDALRTPGYPLFLAVLMDPKPGPATLTRILLVQALLSTLTLPLAYGVFRSFLPFPAALGALALSALSPHLVAANSYVLSETLFGCLTVLAVWTAIRAGLSGSRAKSAAAGLVIGLATLVRPAMQIFPLPLAGLLLVHGGRRRGPALALMLLLGFAAASAPWILRNMVTLGSAGDRTLLVNFLHHGLYPHFTFEGSPQSYGYPYRYDPRSDAIGRDLPAVRDEIVRRFRAEPARHLAWFLGGKPVAFWSWNAVQGYGDVFQYPVSASPYLSEPFFRGTHAFMRVTHGLWVALAAIGAVLVWFPPTRMGMPPSVSFPARLTALLPLAMTALHMVGAPFPRYSIPLRPFLYALALLPLSALLHGWKTRRDRPQPG